MYLFWYSRDGTTTRIIYSFGEGENEGIQLKGGGGRGGG